VAIVKASFTKAASRIKASVRYIQHRPGRDGERLSRQLFGVDGALTREEAYELIDEADKGTIFFRLIISPDPRREDSDRDLDLRDIADQAMFALAMEFKRNIEYIAAIHDDHAPHRHVHVIALIPGRLERNHLKLLRETATELSRFQRKERDLAREAVRGVTRSVDRPRVSRVVRLPIPRPTAGFVAKPGRQPVGELVEQSTYEGIPEVFAQSDSEGIGGVVSPAAVRRSPRPSRPPPRRRSGVPTKPSICHVCGQRNCPLQHKGLELDQEV
jgi:hypothetical protein